MIIIIIFILSILSLVLLNINSKENFLTNEFELKTKKYEDQINEIKDNLVNQEYDFNPVEEENKKMLNHLQMDREILDYKLKIY